MTATTIDRLASLLPKAVADVSSREQRDLAGCAEPGCAAADPKAASPAIDNPAMRRPTQMFLAAGVDLFAQTAFATVESQPGFRHLDQTSIPSGPMTLSDAVAPLAMVPD